MLHSEFDQINKANNDISDSKPHISALFYLSEFLYFKVLKEHLHSSLDQDLE